MRKIYLSLCFCFVSVFAAAQSVRIVPVTQQDGMRIFPKEGEESIVNFPSEYLPYKPKINIVLPKDYEQAEGRFCSVYTLGQGEMPKAGVETVFPKQYTQRCIFVNVRLSGSLEKDKLEGFISKELLPYIETNYKAQENPSFKTLMAGETYSSAVLNSLPVLSGYFGKFALMFYKSTSFPQILEGISDKISFYAAATLGNAGRLETMLENSGLNFPDNFAFNIIDGQSVNPPALSGVFNFGYIFDGQTCKYEKVKAVFSAEEASSVSEEPVNFWLALKGKKGCGDINYIPQTLKIAPPFLSWDYSKAAFTVIYGANKGKVKLSGRAGKVLPFTATFKITK